MGIDVLEKIKFNYTPIYRGMLKTGIKKYKKHYISIAKIVSKFIKEQKEDEDTSSFDDGDSEASNNN